MPHPLVYSTAAELTPSELDAVLSSARRARSAQSSQSGELLALQAQLDAEIAIDRDLAALTWPQRIGRRLRARQLGWKLLAVLLALGAVAASLQLLALKGRTAAERSAADLRIAALTAEVEGGEQRAAAVTQRLTEYLAQVRGAVVAAHGLHSAEAGWLEAVQRTVQRVESDAVGGPEETRLRQQRAAIERTLATSQP